MTYLRPPESGSLHFTIEELAVISNTEDPTTCEDTVYTGPHFVAVIDGATSKTDKLWDGQTGGKACSELLKETFHLLPYDVTARQAVSILTMVIKHFYRRHQALEEFEKNPARRFSAALVVVSLLRKEIWLVGSCQCLLNHEVITNRKPVDEVLSEARAAYLESEICRGKTLEELKHNDTGQTFIQPLLERQCLFQNNPRAGIYWYPALDGTYVPDEGIRIIKIPENVDTIVLASNGYPVLKESLEESEHALAELLHEDPLLFRHYKTTRGPGSNQVSFDDRSYLKIKTLHA